MNVVVNELARIRALALREGDYRTVQIITAEMTALAVRKGEGCSYER